MSLYEYRLIRASLLYLVLTGLLGVLFHLFPAMAVYYRTTPARLSASSIGRDI